MAPHLLLQKMPSPSFTAETKVELDAGDEPLMAGLVVIGETSAALVVERDNKTAARRIVLRIDDRIAASRPIANEGPIRLRVAVGTGGVCRFGYIEVGAPQQPIDATFTARAGRWVGAQVGIFAATPNQTAGALDAHADFDYFWYPPL